MGTEKCPFCGQEIDAAATKCFFCGAVLDEKSVHNRLEQLHDQDIRSSRRIHKHHLVKAIVILILATIVLFYGKSGRKHSSDTGSSPQPSAVNLNAKVDYRGEVFIISNNDSFEWKNVNLEIVPESKEDRFRLRITNISAGESYSAKVTEFLNDAGIRFNPDKIKMGEFWIKCDTSTGNGSYYLAEIQ